MAAYIKLYKDEPDRTEKRYYVHHAFSDSEGRSRQATYQVVEILREMWEDADIDEKTRIPRGTLHEYRDLGWLYTKQEGPPGIVEEDRPDEEPDEEPVQFLDEKDIIVEFVMFDDENGEAFVFILTGEEREIRGITLELDDGTEAPEPGSRFRVHPAANREDVFRAEDTDLRPSAGEVFVDRDNKHYRIQSWPTSPDRNYVEVEALHSDFEQTLRKSRLVGSDGELAFCNPTDDLDYHWRAVPLGTHEVRQASGEWENLLRALIWNDPETSVDWAHIGEQCRERLEGGRHLPKPVWRQLRERRTEDGKRASDVWEALRRAHMEACWYHLSDGIELRHLRSGLGSDFGVNALIASDEELTPETPVEDIDLRDLLESANSSKETSLPPKIFVQRLAEDLGADCEADNWAQDGFRSVFLDQLPDFEDWYERFPLEKSSGDKRWVDEPHPKLKRAQRRIASVLEGYNAHHCSVSGFAKRRSNILHARLHTRARAAVRMDIRRFFPNISDAQVWEALNRGPRLDGITSHWSNPFARWPEGSLHAIRRLVTHPIDGRLPQGAPSSPSIANLVAAPLDEAISSRLREVMPTGKWTYSRYADDLVVSTSRKVSHDKLDEVESLLAELVEDRGWQIAPEKTRKWRSYEKGPLTVCGIQVPTERGERLRLPRSDRRRLRAALHHFEVDEVTEADRGLVAYAYAVTGRHRLRVTASEKCRNRLESLAEAVCPEPDDAEEFVEGWLAE